LKIGDSRFPFSFNFQRAVSQNHFSLTLKHFLINLRLVAGDFKTRSSGSISWNRFSFTSPSFMSKKRFNERLKDFCLGNSPSIFDRNDLIY